MAREERMVKSISWPGESVAEGIGERASIIGGWNGTLPNFGGLVVAGQD